MLWRRPPLLVLVAVQFSVMLGWGIVVPILPFYARSMGASAFEMALLVTIFAVTQLIFAPFWGTLSDKIGRKPILVIGLIGYSLSISLLSVANSVPTLLLGRLLGGILSSTALPTSQALAADMTSRSERGAIMSMVGAGTGLGLIFGPVVGGVLAPLGLKVPFYVAGILSLATAILGWAILQEGPSRLTERSANKGRVGAGTLLPTLQGPEAHLYVLSFVVMFGHSNLFSNLSYYMMDKVGANEASVGLTFTVQGITSVLMQGLLVGRMLRWLGENLTLMVSLVVGAFGFINLIAANGMPQMMAGVVLITTCTSLSRPTIASAISTRARVGQGAAMGINTSFDSLGRVLGPLWAGFAYSHAMVAPYWSSVVLLLGALAFLMIVLRVRAAGDAAQSVEVRSGD